jgi:addiction module HigA family antidote
MFERPNIHPGEILREEFLKPAGVSICRLADDLGLPCGKVDGIVSGRDGVCAETAIRLSHYFGTSERFWLEAQMTYDLERARRSTAEIRRRIRPLSG